MHFLDELLDYIPFPGDKKVGRKPVSTKDKIFYLTLQSYNIKSSRRCIADLEIARRLGFIDKAMSQPMCLNTGNVRIRNKRRF